MLLDPARWCPGIRPGDVGSWAEIPSTEWFSACVLRVIRAQWSSYGAILDSLQQATEYLHELCMDFFSHVGNLLCFQEGTVQSRQVWMVVGRVLHQLCCDTLLSVAGNDVKMHALFTFEIHGVAPHPLTRQCQVVIHGLISILLPLNHFLYKMKVAGSLHLLLIDDLRIVDTQQELVVARKLAHLAFHGTLTHTLQNWYLSDPLTWWRHKSPKLCCCVAAGLALNWMRSL